MTKMGERAGYRGYIFSRSIDGNRSPQHIQNLVIRDYAARNGLMFKLSATEYTSEDCYLMLDTVLSGLRSLEGVILYSMFMLPADEARRRSIYDRVLAAGAVLHAAVEDYRIVSPADVARIEDIWKIHQAMAGSAPLATPMAS